jgi:hypothetical protein
MVSQSITVWSINNGTNNIVQADTITDGVSSIVDLSAAGQDAYLPQIAIDSLGNAVAVWFTNNFIIQASTKTLNGNWTTPTDLSAAGQDGPSPQIAIDSLGNATAIWSLCTNPTNYTIQASTKTLNGSWSTPTDLSAAGQNAAYPQIAIDSLGNAIAVWARSNGTNIIIQASTKTLNGTWSTPTDLSADGRNATSPQIAIDSFGNAIAVWARSNGTNIIIQASTKTLNGTWSTPTDLSAVGQDAGLPQIAIDSLGNAIAVWARYNSTGGIIQASTKTLNGTWSTPIDLSAAGQLAPSPQIAIDSLGNAIAVWTIVNGTYTTIQASTKTLNGTWSTPTDLSAAGGIASAPQIAIDSLGNAIAVWTRNSSTGGIIQASTKTLNGSWSTPTDLSAAGGSALNPQIALYYKASTTTTTTEPICLVAGTPIVTDQGIVRIEQIDTTKHTIGNKRIVAVTKTITPEKHLVVFEKDSIAINCPSQRTIMTPGHEVLYKGKLVQSKHFVGRLDGVHTIPYNGKDILYNVLLEQHGLMKVNNMVLETLHPSNKVAKQILENAI